MSIDERELRSRLAETAALAGPPRSATKIAIKAAVGKALFIG